MLNMTKTMEDLMFLSMKGGYFQKLSDPLIVFCASTKPKIIENKVVLYSSLDNKAYEIPLEQLRDYRSVSEKYAKRVLADQERGLGPELIEEFNREMNKANLSEKISKVKYSTYPITDEELLGEKE